MLKLNIKKSLKPLLFVFLVTLLLSGCSISRNIYVTRSSAVNNESIELNFIGANKENIHDLKNCSYYQYWNFDSPIEKELAYRMSFLPHGKQKHKICTKNKIWDKWHSNGSDYLFILADYSSVQVDDGTKWKRKIKLERYSFYNFWSNRNLYVYLGEKGISIKKDISKKKEEEKPAESKSSDSSKGFDFSKLSKMPGGDMEMPGGDMPKMPGGGK